MNIEDIYIHYNNYIRSVVDNNNIDNFKSNQYYTQILEHVSFNQGLEYLSLIKRLTNISEADIINYCKLNDKIGGGVKNNFGFITTSPSNLRYIFHAHLILSHMKKLNISDTNIVEVGGGYGGMCLAIDFFSQLYNVKINKYNIIDLPNIIKLQEMYISNFKTSFETTFNSAFNFGENITDTNLFLISNYCFSEISREYQTQYINKLFPKISHGFIAWNMIPTYNFGFTFTEEIEYPLTGPMNKYVYF